MAMTYKDVGVDIHAKSAILDAAKADIARSHNASVLKGIGHFGGLFALDTPGMTQPVLIASADGVGTKVDVAALVNNYATIGRDLVHHCINDILCCGAKPLFFLDYVAAAHLEPDTLAQILRGLSAACAEHDTPLIGGETAEMPGVYVEGKCDLVGTIVGVVDRSRILDGARIQPGDLLIGLPASGLHTNGYTLARKVLFNKFKPTDAPDELGGCTVADELLKVHRCYEKQIRPILTDDAVTGLAHVTGGGILNNTARILPAGLALDVDFDAWTRPPVFDLIQKLGSVPEDDMRQTFNLGIGMIVVVRPDSVDRVMTALADQNAPPIRIGAVTKA